MNSELQYLNDIHKNVVLWIEEMILRGDLRLSDIPQSIRLSDYHIYVAAFRASRSNRCYRFICDLNVLCDDIISLYDTDNKKKAKLVSLLSDTLRINDYKGEERFEDFKKSMSEVILRELSRYELAHDEVFRDMLRSYCNENGIDLFP